MTDPWEGKSGPCQIERLDLRERWYQDPGFRQPVVLVTFVGPESFSFVSLRRLQDRLGFAVLTFSGRQHRVLS